jgi:hypothetical protein
MGLQLAARADAVRIARALQNWPYEYGMSIILTVSNCFDLNLPGPLIATTQDRWVER